MAERMTITDEGRSGAKTSLKMTRSMSEDIGLKVKEIFEKIAEGTVDLKYTEWQWLITQCWSDEIWVSAVNKAIYKAEVGEIDLNHNGAFFQLIRERTLLELKKEFTKTHPIAKMSLMDILLKKPPKKEREHQYKDIWLTPEERKRLYAEEN